MQTNLTVINEKKTEALMLIAAESDCTSSVTLHRPDPPRGSGSHAPDRPARASGEEI
jgi:hypothetical protein